mmetsp:Transcript_118075/g.252272  ORF Transcript_118075/g.252272 Transcript_118075/m.252272 type:complete len:336 (-) Transcript_118075:188-1195(-)
MGMGARNACPLQREHQQSQGPTGEVILVKHKLGLFPQLRCFLFGDPEVPPLAEERAHHPCNNLRLKASSLGFRHGSATSAHKGVAAQARPILPAQLARLLALLAWQHPGRVAVRSLVSAAWANADEALEVPEDASPLHKRAQGHYGGLHVRDTQDLALADVSASTEMPLKTAIGDFHGGVDHVRSARVVDHGAPLQQATSAARCPTGVGVHTEETQEPEEHLEVQALEPGQVPVGEPPRHSRDGLRTLTARGHVILHRKHLSLHLPLGINEGEQQLHMLVVERRRPRKALPIYLHISDLRRHGLEHGEGRQLCLPQEQEALSEHQRPCLEVLGGH